MERKFSQVNCLLARAVPFSLLKIGPFASPPNPHAAAQRSAENSARLVLRGIRLNALISSAPHRISDVTVHVEPMK